MDIMKGPKPSNLLLIVNYIVHYLILILILHVRSMSCTSYISYARQVRICMQNVSQD